MDGIELVIKIDKNTFVDLKKKQNRTEVDNAVLNGTLLDSNSEKAEVQAYFDGQAYGWEEGRKD